MNILITNDDGIDSRGIHALRDALMEIAEVLVIAPLGEQSAVGHALTVSLPLRVTEFHKNQEFFGYAVSGTPADCVKLALRTFLAERGLPRPDLVVSGINHGHNAGISVIYSGTVSAATEATVLGVPAIAVSLKSYSEGIDFRPAAEFTRDLAPVVVQRGLPQGTLLNVNVPAVSREELRGVAFTRQGSSHWEDEFEKRLDPQERPYYWLKGEYIVVDQDEGVDDGALSKNMISVTPIQYDLTDHRFLEAMRKDWSVVR